MHIYIYIYIYIYITHCHILLLQMMKADARAEARVEMKVAAVGGALRGLTPSGKVGDQACGCVEVEQVPLARPLLRSYLRKIHELYEAFPHQEL